MSKTVDKVKNAVWECGSNKAPGPDGFSFVFIKKYWDLMKMDIFEFVNSFFASGLMPQGANSSFLRLSQRSVIDKVVSKEQSAFISSRQILDGPLIISEIIQWYKKRKKKMLIFKVDFEKAFDSVSWKYLNFILDRLGFGSKCRSWIRACLHSSRASILIIDSFGVVLKILGIWRGFNGLKFSLFSKKEACKSALHGQEGGGCSFNGTWSRIIGTSNFLHSKGVILLNSFCFKVGCDTRVRFWKDIWIGDSPLHTRYNRLYRLDQDKDCLIIDRIVNSQWQWNWSKSDIGTCNTAYLNDLLLEISQIDISADEDTYRLAHRLNLSSRGLDIPTIPCSFCNSNVESSDHVFFECDLVKEIWCLVRKWCDLSIPTFASYDTCYSWFSTWQATKAKSRRLYIIFAALFWWIWRYRNSVTFSSDSIKKGDLFDNIRASSFSWISNRGHVPCNWVE
nr:RNA-directed DNA polymerase, eukaryota, reverse transcriptase zinc-binding domain protein [Tanacetum cinerariifolium]